VVVVRVLLLADHKWRDLPGLAAVKVCLEDEFRISARIVPLHDFEAGMVAVRPHAVVLNHMNGPRNLFIARTAKRMGSAVMVIPTEGRPQTNELMRFTTGQFADLSCVDLWLTWSEAVRDIMVAERRLPQARLRVVGAPRFDFYAPALRSVLQPTEEFERKHEIVPGRPIVSWATNFILARHVRTNTLDFLVRDFKSLRISELPVYSDPVPLAERDLQVRLRTLEILKRLCLRFPQVNFVVKPHPHEETGDYAAFVAGCRADGLDNVNLVTEEYIWDVLNSAAIHVHRLCTTGIEAWLMGIPSVNFHTESYGGWNLDQDGPAKEALAGDDLVTDEKSLAERIEHYLTGAPMDPEKIDAQQQYVRRWFYRIDGLSSMRCAQAISEYLDASRPKPILKLWSLGPRSLLRMAINRALARPLHAPIRSRVRFENGVPVDALGQRDKKVRDEDVARWAEMIRNCKR
jgi:surface carbohydrate biosynthesis protein